MNAGDPSFVEENSQSYNSDSSSIPSSLSDCEGEPLQDLPFSVQGSSFSQQLKWFIARDKTHVGLPSVDNGNSLPLSLGTSLNQNIPAAHVDVGQNLPESDRLATFEGDLIHLTEEDLLASSCALGQLELGTGISESGHPGSPVMSRTLPVKIRDKSQAALPVTQNSPSAEAGSSTKNGSDCDDPKVQSPLNSPSKSDNGDGIGISSKSSASFTSEQVSAVSFPTRSELAEKQAILNTHGETGAGYNSLDDEFRQEPKQSPPSQSQQTAFPIPPVPEQSDPLMRHIDSLSMPTVSPDSGIFASSPSGNDSPGSVTSVTAGEATNEPPPSSQPQVSVGEMKAQRQQELVILPSPSVSEEDKKAKEDKGGKFDRLPTCNKTAIEDVSQESDHCIEDTFVSEIPSPFRGPSIGRKKRGRPPKRNKSQMLQHKKSTLYSGLYRSENVSASISTAASGEKADGSAVIPHNSAQSSSSENQSLVDNTAPPSSDEHRLKSLEKSHSKEVNSDSAGCSKAHSKSDQQNTESSIPKDMENEKMIAKNEDDTSGEAPLIKRRGRGRPKGSKNKRFFTVVKNRAWKAKVAKGLVAVPVEKVIRQKSISKQTKKCSEIVVSPRKEKGQSSSKSECVKSPITSKGESDVKKRRGRPRKHPALAAVNNSEMNEDSHGCSNKSTPNISPNKDTVVRSRQFVSEKSKAETDSELASLIQSVHHSIQSQFASRDIDESSEFAVDTSNDISGIEPSLPRVGMKSPLIKAAKSSGLKVAKRLAPKKPKVHVMMRRTKRKKKKRLQKEQPKTASAASPKPSKVEEESLTNNSIQDLPEQQCPTVSSGSLFGPSSSKQLCYFNSYRPSKIIKQSSFRLQSSALGNALCRTGEDSSDDDRDGSEGRKKKKKKKLLYFKTKHKNIIDPAFVAELGSLESSMDKLTISEQAFIRVKPGEVPLPSIFRLNIIDVKRKKKDKLVLEPPPAPEKSKKVKMRKDSKEREPPMPELVKEKIKNVRKKSPSEDNHPPSLEIQVARDQCLPPKKRHRMMYEAESTDDVTELQKETPVPEKRKVGRPRKNPLPDSSSAIERAASADSRNEGCKSNRERSPGSVSSPSKLSLKKRRHSSGGACKERVEETVHTSSSQSPLPSSVLTCPRHAHHKCLSEVSSCAECTLLAQSQPQAAASKSHTRQQIIQDSSFHAKRNCKSKKPLIKTQTLSANQSRRKGNGSINESQLGTAVISPSTSPRSRTKMIAAALPSAEVVINPLPESTVSAVVGSQLTRKLSLNLSCNTSNFSDSGAEDDSVIRSVCSEFEPLPLEHCLKRQQCRSETQNRGKRRMQEDSGCEDNAQRFLFEGDGVKRNSDDSQPPRKRYQRVGLFSNFYKDDEPKKRNETFMRNQTKVSHKKQESPSPLLPPPIHFGKHFREMVIPFQLPYDIWWLFTHDMLPKKEAPRPKFKRIRNNVYVDVKTNTRKFEPHPCNCKRPSNPQEKGCLDDCLNRVVFTECTPETCPCGDQCSNQSIQRQEWPPALEKFVTSDRGFGVRTLKSIPVDQIILEYLGEVVSEQEFRRRMTEEYANDSHHYCLNMDGRTVIDGYRMGNLTRFVNHSCEPNCEMQKWNVNGLYHMVLRTLREIKSYEEITYDYNFHSFNMEAQQACRCGSSECRGVIGGKFQRNGQQKQSQIPEVGLGRLVSPSMKPMSQRERMYARKHAIFLVRNIDRARGDRQQGVEATQEKTEEQATFDKVPNLLSMKDSMNDNRSVTTRLGSLASTNPIVRRRHQLALIFHDVYNAVASCRDDEGNILATPLMILPSRKKYPDYYRAISHPIDLTTIRNKIQNPGYNDIHSFDADFLQLFKNVETYCGKMSDMGRVIGRLRRVYQAACAEAVPLVEGVTGEGVTTLSSAASSEANSTEDTDVKVHPVAEDEEEDIIRCICGVYRDEGVMIQCEKCFIWQHCDCVKVKASDAEREDMSYRCELCDPRPVEKEILDPQKKDQLGPNGEKCEQFLTLMRDDLQIAQGDCVYLMRDFKRPARASLRSLAFTSPDKMDIFRIEDLFKNSKGERFATGNMYLRPHETFHEPNRKFFHNELFRYPQYETYPLEQVAGKCMVMDLNTFCKGKPKGFDTRDIYICEFRVDKTARLFSKIGKKFPINTKSFCFDKYPQRLCPKRTYVPHEVPEEYLRRGTGEKSADSQNSRKSSSSSVGTASGEACKSEGKTDSKSEGRSEGKSDVSDLKKVKMDRKDGVMRLKMEEDKKNAKKERLNNYVMKLLAKTSGRQKDDVSYLLEESLGKRPRKKTAAFF